MPAKDIYHDTVKNALIKDGWQITHDPFTLEFKSVRLFADLAAEKAIDVEQVERAIVVEIKTFNSLSLITELEKAIGQYNIYRLFLKLNDNDRKLFLAISQTVYQNFFQQPAIAEIISDQHIKLLIFNSETEEIIQWIN
ncbi:fdxN element excision controlling factor protein [Beggiatoa sp. PS]|nr:fdxN element excision controlling factor protein [Beggiatoa sp. PS]